MPGKVPQKPIPGDLAREEHDRIDRELANAQAIQATAGQVNSIIEATLRRAVELVGRCDEVYRRGNGRTRRLRNQFFFQ
ncbi:MAG: hypothetical protein ACRDZW_11075 [Acidimicrobiales bacterium]